MQVISIMFNTCLNIVDTLKLYFTISNDSTIRRMINVVRTSQEQWYMWYRPGTSGIEVLLKIYLDRKVENVVRRKLHFGKIYNTQNSIFL
jgi:hypothetical protein